VYIRLPLILGDNESHSQEDEGMELDNTSPQSSSTQAATSSGVVLNKDHRSDSEQEDMIPVVEPVSEQGNGQMIEDDIIEAPPVSCTSPADMMYLTVEDFVIDTVSDPPIFLFPPIMAGPGETLQV